MTISDKDLFLAILAMDAYNRGSGAGINDTGNGDNNGLGTTGQVGTANIIVDSAILTSSGVRVDEAAGFYAVAYATEYGTVISYRGTDTTPLGDFTPDATQGWPLGGGDYFTAQTALSIEFLDAVQADNTPGSVILTGHSLGGGLGCSFATLSAA